MYLLLLLLAPIHAEMVNQVTLGGPTCEQEHVLRADCQKEVVDLKQKLSAAHLKIGALKSQVRKLQSQLEGRSYVRKQAAGK